MLISLQYLCTIVFDIHKDQDLKAVGIHFSASKLPMTDTDTNYTDLYRLHPNKAAVSTVPN